MAGKIVFVTHLLVVRLDEGLLAGLVEGLAVGIAEELAIGLAVGRPAQGPCLRTGGRTHQNLRPWQP